MRKRIVAIVLAVALALSLCVCFTACNDGGDTRTAIRISTTTSVNDSGLLGYLTPYFELDNPNYKLEISSAGTGAAINAAKYGNADLILVHSKSQEDAFVTAGFARKVGDYSAERISFMKNYFILAGATADPAGIVYDPTKTAVENDSAPSAFNKIAALGTSKFVSRDDNSGTHTKEIDLWNKASLLASSSVVLKDYTNTYAGTSKTIKIPTGDWYVQAGSGMGASLTMANEQNAYILTDKATFLSYKNNKDGDKLPNLSIILDGANDMLNTYSMIAVSKDAPFVSSVDGSALAAGTVSVNEAAANAFIAWMMSDTARGLISMYGTTSYGEALFQLI